MGEQLRRVPRGAITGLVLAVLLWAALPLAVAMAPQALVNFGPHDEEYASGLRVDWERDGRTIYHWSEPSTRVVFPLRLEGAARLQIRLRRHFMDPAQVRIRVEGQRVAEFEISATTLADPARPWAVMEFGVPAQSGDRPFSVEVLVTPQNGRSLGLALDWMEVKPSPGAHFRPLPNLTLRAVLAVLGLCLLLILSGAPTWATSLTGGLLGVALLLGGALDPMALERILRLGLPSFLFGTAVAVAACGLAGRWSRAPLPAAALVGLVAAALAVRLVLLLHPEFYYPDVRVHGVFARELVKLGPAGFMSAFIANQFRFSLGLQFVSGHWYAFPYPPLFYLLTFPLTRWMDYAPETAVSLLAAMVNSLEVLLIFGLGRRLLGPNDRFGALASAAAVPLLPIFLSRLSMGYFPAIVGHGIDTVLMLVLVGLWPTLARARAVLLLGATLGLALLTYTQALLNFGLLLPLFLLLQVVRDGSPEGRRRQAALVLSGLLGLGVAMTFYARYVPVFAQMRQGAPMAGEQIVLDKMANSRFAYVAEEEDPLLGPNLDLLRGFRKAGWRLLVFYGWFTPLIVLGGGLLYFQLAPGDMRRLLALWAGTFLILNFLSGSLPGPNLFRYNKDMEFVAPLACLALGWLWVRMRDWSRVAGLGLSAAYLLYFGARAAEYLRLQTFIDRVSGL